MIPRRRRFPLRPITKLVAEQPRYVQVNWTINGTPGAYVKAVRMPWKLEYPATTAAPASTKGPA